MKYIIYIALLVTSLQSFGQCEEQLKAVFNNYTQKLKDFDYGESNFHMVFNQVTSYKEEGESKSVNTRSELVSNGYLKHLEVGNTSVYTNKEIQIFIDRDKQLIVISTILTTDLESVGFDGFNELDKLIANVRCKPINNGKNEEMVKYTFSSDSLLADRSNKSELVVDQSSNFKRYVVNYTDDLEGAPYKIVMSFEEIDFDCESCQLEEDILSLILTKKGKLKDEFANFELTDLRQKTK